MTTRPTDGAGGRDELLSPHFARSEAAVSAEHPELVEPLPDRHAGDARILARTVLEPLRHDLARPIRVLSWYRGERLNRAVGGSPTSQHRLAQAADIVLLGLDARAVFRHLLLRIPMLPHGQAILYPERGFVHLALPSRTYRTPTFFVHSPPRALIYARCAGPSALDLLLDTAIDT